MATKKEIIVIDISVETKDIPAQLAKIKNETQTLKIENQQLAKAYAEAFAENRVASMKKISGQMAQNDTQLKKLGTQYTQYNSTLNKVAQQEKAKAGSYEDLLREYELEQTILKTRMDMIVLNEKGERVLSEAYKEASVELKKKKDVLDQFNKGIGDGRSSVGQYAEGIREAFAATGLFGEKTGVLGDALKTAKGGADLFKNGIKGVGAALTTTGLPLFATALSTIVGLFNKNEAAAEGFQRVMAAIGAVTDSLIGILISLGKGVVSIFTDWDKNMSAIGDYINNTLIKYIESLGNIIKGVFTLDFGTFKKGFTGIGEAVTAAVAPAKNAANGIKNFGNSMADAVKEAVALTKRMQDLEDKERAFQNESEKTKLKVDELIKAARERAGSEAERIKLLDEAAQLEKELLATEENLAAERLAIITGQNALLAKQGQLRDEDDQKRVDAETNLTKLKGESAIKQQEIDNRKTLLINQLNKQEIQNRIDTLNSKVALEEANGRNTIALRRKIAEEEKKILLEDAKDNKVKQEQIELDYQAKMTAIAKKAADERKAITDQTTDLRIQSIADVNLREITQANEEFKRKIETLKGQYSNEAQLREQFEIELANKLRAVQQRIEEETEAKRTERIQRETDTELSAIDSKYQQLERSARENKVNTEKGEIEFNNSMLQLQLRRAQEEFEVVVNSEARKQLAVETAYANEFAALQKQIDAGAIKQEKYNADLIELDKRYAIKREEQSFASTQVIKENEQNLANARTEIVIVAGQEILEIEKKDAAFRADIQKQTIGFITQGFEAVTAILAKDEASKKKNADLLKTLATAQILLNLYAEISGYWKGVGVDAGTTGNLYTTGASAAIAAVSTALAVTRATLAIGNVTSTKAYAEGGHTGSGFNFTDSTGYRVAGVVHENEWVAPEWMVRNPQVAPLIGSLENMRKTGKALPFADGGYTTAFITQQAINNTPVPAAQSVEEILKRVTIVASAAEITDTQSVSAQIQQNASI